MGRRPVPIIHNMDLGRAMRNLRHERESQGNTPALKVVTDEPCSWFGANMLTGHAYVRQYNVFVASFSSATMPSEEDTGVMG